MQAPQISIIIASYNKAGFIKETICSVLDQSFRDWELIIVDDHSTDNTVPIIHAAYNDPRIKLIVGSENKGANFCRNTGLKEAKGDYVIFLDADDVLTADCLQQRLSAAKAHPGKNLLVFSMGVFYKNTGDDPRKWIPTSRQPMEDFLQHDLPWSILQPFWRRNFLNELGGFDESFSRLQDVELNTRALLHKDVSYLLMPGRPDCFYRIDEDRRNFQAFQFMQRWVTAAIQYCDKFYRLVPPQKIKYLLGTLYQTYLSLLLMLRNGQIEQAQFAALERDLLQQASVISSSRLRLHLFKLGRSYNLKLLRIPGVNRLIKKMLLA